MKLSQLELLRIIARKECPFCEGAKLDGCMFCEKCYARLPLRMQGRIRNGLRTLSESLREAMNFLEGQWKQRPISATAYTLNLQKMNDSS